MRPTHFGILGGALLMLSGCLSNTPTRTLTGDVNDPVAAAQREALGLGDMATKNAGNLPPLTATSFTGIGSGLTSLNASNISSGTLANARTSADSANTLNTIVARDVSGNFSAGTITATLSGNATSASNLASGTPAALPYQTAANTTTMLSRPTVSGNYALTITDNTAPAWSTLSSLNVGSAASSTTATHLSGGIAGNIPYQNAPNQTTFLAPGNSGEVLTFGGSSAPAWVAPSTLTVGNATNANSADTAQKLTFQAVPSSSGVNCDTGQVARDATFFYVCINNNSWKRIPWDTASW